MLRMLQLDYTNIGTEKARATFVANKIKMYKTAVKGLGSVKKNIVKVLIKNVPKVRPYLGFKVSASSGSKAVLTEKICSWDG